MLLYPDEIASAYAGFLASIPEIFISRFESEQKRMLKLAEQDKADEAVYLKIIAESSIRENKKAAVLAYAINRQKDEVKNYLRACTEHFPVKPEYREVMFPRDYIAFLGISCLAGGKQKRNVAASLPREYFSLCSPSKFELLTTETLQDLLNGHDEEAAHKTDEAEALLNAAAWLSKRRRAFDAGTIGLRRALLARDTEAWNRACVRRQELWTYRYADPEAALEPEEALLDFETLILTLAARERGMAPGPQSVYVPLSLLPQEA